MNSQRLKQALCGLGVAAAVLALTPPAAVADPPPANSTDALNQLHAAGVLQEQLNEKFKVAQENLKNAQSDVMRANTDLAKAKQDGDAAKAAQGQFRGQVDKLVDASYQGAQFTNLSAMLSGQSPEDFLDRSWALEQLGSQNRESLDGLNAAVDKAAAADRQAQQAKQRATEAVAASQQLSDDLAQRKVAADKAVADAQTAYNRLSSPQKAALKADRGEPVGALNVPAGTAGNAVRNALSQVGVTYVLGGEKPGVEFDCSGLVQWAYRAAGVNITRITTTQYQEGVAVSKDALIPGDLVFFGTADNIHHVAMYIGNGQIVHAPDVGQVVKVASLATGGGRDYFGARRIVNG